MTALNFELRASSLKNENPKIFFAFISALCRSAIEGLLISLLEYIPQDQPTKSEMMPAEDSRRSRSPIILRSTVTDQDSSG